MEENSKRAFVQLNLLVYLAKLLPAIIIGVLKRRTKCSAVCLNIRVKELKLWLVSGVYTAISLGASIFLWPFLSTVPIFEAKPLFLIHPIFALELTLLFSVIILWSVTSLLSVKSILNQKLMQRKIVEQNSLLILLVIITLVVAISGCLVFSKTPFFERPLYVGGLDILYGIPPPNPYGILYGLGILFCESTWITLVILKCSKR